MSYYQPERKKDKKRKKHTYRTLEVLGPEHEVSVVDEQLKALPIVDKIIKDFCGRFVNFVGQPNFTFGKELQMHVMEVKPNKPFKSPVEFEETMQEAVLTLLDFLKRKYDAYLLGTGMHPLLNLEDTCIWPHRHKQIYEALSRIFNLKQHGWLNIQSFQLNLPYENEEDAFLLYNALANVCAYLPAICASSPVYEGKLSDYLDNRLCFYKTNQKEIPSITGQVVPEYVSSFRQYQKEVIGKYTSDLEEAGADKILLNKDWVNSRGVIIRFDRKALEIRVMDEQECIKSDVALSCFIRALLRSLIQRKFELLPHNILVENFNLIIRNGLEAHVSTPKSQTARQICQNFLEIASEKATEEEKRYLPIIQRRIEFGSLSEIIRKRLQQRAQRTDFKNAIINVYSELLNSLRSNQPYF